MTGLGWRKIQGRSMNGMESAAGQAPSDVARTFDQGMLRNECRIDDQTAADALIGAHTTFRVQRVGWTVCQLVAEGIELGHVGLKIARVVQRAEKMDGGRHVGRRGRGVRIE